MRFFPLGVLLIVLSACLDEPDCIVTATNEVHIRLLKLSSDSIDSAQTMKFTKIEVSGTDSIFFAGDSVAVLVLPVNPNTMETTFRFYYNPTVDSLVIDSIVVSYSSRSKMISPQCGAYNYFQDLEVLFTSFAEVEIVNSTLSTSGNTNMAIKL